MSRDLLDDQQALLAALWASTHQNAIHSIASRAMLTGATGQKLMERGLSAYRANAQALAPRSLASAYPVVFQLLGEENFEGMARQHWHDHPPERGDLAQWGDKLANHMAMLPGLLEQEPYLSDVARVEWALHLASNAADASMDLASLCLLAERDPAGVFLELSPGAACIVSPYPVVTIVQAHLHEPLPGTPGTAPIGCEPSEQVTTQRATVATPLAEDSLPDLALELPFVGVTLAQAGQRLAQGVAETALVWRQGMKPQLRVAHVGEMRLLAAVQSGASVLEALAAAPRLDFQVWFAHALRSGLVVGAKAL